MAGKDSTTARLDRIASLADAWDKAAALPWDGLGSFDREDAQNDTLRACAFALRALLPGRTKISNDKDLDGGRAAQNPDAAVFEAHALPFLKNALEYIDMDDGEVNSFARDNLTWALEILESKLVEPKSRGIHFRGLSFGWFRDKYGSTGWQISHGCRRCHAMWSNTAGPTLRSMLSHYRATWRTHLKHCRRPAQSVVVE